MVGVRKSHESMRLFLDYGEMNKNIQTDIFELYFMSANIQNILVKT